MREFEEACTATGFGSFAQHIFQSFDANHSGGISYRELVQALEQKAMAPHTKLASENEQALDTPAKICFSALVWAEKGGRARPKAGRSQGLQAEPQESARVDTTGWRIHSTTPEGVHHELQTLMSQSGAHIVSAAHAIRSSHPALVAHTGPVGTRPCAPCAKLLGMRSSLLPADESVRFVRHPCTHYASGGLGGPLRPGHGQLRHGHRRHRVLPHDARALRMQLRARPETGVRGAGYGSRWRAIRTLLPLKMPLPVWQLPSFLHSTFRTSFLPAYCIQFDELFEFIRGRRHSLDRRNIRVRNLRLQPPEGSSAWTLDQLPWLTMEPAAGVEMLRKMLVQMLERGGASTVDFMKLLDTYYKDGIGYLPRPSSDSTVHMPPFVSCGTPTSLILPVCVWSLLLRRCTHEARALAEHSHLLSRSAGRVQPALGAQGDADHRRHVRQDGPSPAPRWHLGVGAWHHRYCRTGALPPQASASHAERWTRSCVGPFIVTKKLPSVSTGARITSRCSLTAQHNAASSASRANADQGGAVAHSRDRAAAADSCLAALTASFGHIADTGQVLTGDVPPRRRRGSGF